MESNREPQTNTGVKPALEAASKGEERAKIIEGLRTAWAELEAVRKQFHLPGPNASMNKYFSRRHAELSAALEHIHQAAEFLKTGILRKQPMTLILGLERAQQELFGIAAAMEGKNPFKLKDRIEQLLLANARVGQARQLVAAAPAPKAAPTKGGAHV